MAGYLASILLLAALLLGQLSFIPFLPGVFSLWPMSFTFGIYLFQHQSLRLGIGLIVLTGVALDLTRVGILPFETFSYSIAGGTAVFFCRHLFSNRSFSGVVGCVAATYAVLKLSQLMILTGLWLADPRSVQPGIFWQEAWIGLALALLTVVVIFPFAKALRQLLFRTFLLSKRHETYEGRSSRDRRA